MHTLASPTDSGWLDILSRLPPDIDLNQLARETKAIQRLRGIADAADLLRLGMVHGPGGLTLKKTAAWAYLSGVAEISPPALSDRLHQSVAFFSAIVGRLLAARPPPAASLWHGRCLHLCDSSSIAEPGSKGTDWRIHAVYDLGRGGFSHLELTDARGAETVNRGAPVTGSGHEQVQRNLYQNNYVVASFLNDLAGGFLELLDGFGGIGVSFQNAAEAEARSNHARTTVGQAVLANLFPIQRDHSVDEQHDRETLAEHGGQMAAGFAHAETPA
jgi:hypothetical protein